MSTYHQFAASFSKGEVHLNAWITIPDSAVVEAMAAAPFESITFDMQHGRIQMESVIAGVTAAALAGKPAVVRVPVADYSSCSRALDAGARGIIFPMTETARDAQALVDYTRYPPVGRRSWGAYRALAMSGMTHGEFLRSENDNSLVLAMIETATAVENVESILSTPGIDGIYVGPNDLCISMTDGRCARPDHALVTETCARLAGITLAMGKVPGIYANTPTLAIEFAAYGFRFISVGSDAEFLRGRADAVADEVRRATGTETEGASCQQSR